MTEHEFKRLMSILHDYYFHVLANRNTSEWSADVGASANSLQCFVFSTCFSVCLHALVYAWDYV